jgi:hypothetical protein
MSRLALSAVMLVALLMPALLAAPDNTAETYSECMIGLLLKGLGESASTASAAAVSGPLRLLQQQGQVSDMYVKCVQASDQSD